MKESTTTPSPSRRGWHRKVAAVLAGGLVLGVGTMATLASWNDSEFAGATFTSGKFDLEGSTDNGASYSSHAYPATGALTFSSPVSNLSPGDVVNASFPVRLAAGTTNNAKLNLSSISWGGGDIKGLRLVVWQNTSADCNATYTPATMIDEWDGVSWTVGTQPTLTKGATAAQSGAPVYVCLKMIADNNLPQGQVVPEWWYFVATSQ